MVEDLIGEAGLVREALDRQGDLARPFGPGEALARQGVPHRFVEQPGRVLGSDRRVAQVEVITMRLRELREARHPNFDAALMLEHLAHFTDLSSNIVKEIEIRRDGRWGQRLMKYRATVSDAMSSFMERAAKEIAAALPVVKSGSYGGGPRVPDFSKRVDLEKTDIALRYARLIAGARPFAAAASFGATLKDVDERVTTQLRRYTEDMIKELRTSGGERRAIIEHQTDVVSELTAILFSEEEAELLRRRGRAAQAAA